MNAFTIDNMNPIFGFLEDMKGVAQKPEFHPEGDVYNHTIQVLMWAMRETDDVDLIISAICHDFGKAVISNGHAKISASMIEDYTTGKTHYLVKNHMRIREFVDGRMRKLGKVKLLAESPWLPELIQLCRWDNMGRNPRSRPKFDKYRVIDGLNEKADRHFGKVGGGYLIPSTPEGKVFVAERNA